MKFIKKPFISLFKKKNNDINIEAQEKTEKSETYINIENYDLSPEYIESKKIIESVMPERRFFEIGDLPSVQKPVFITKYIAGFISTGNGVLTLGICTDSDAELSYKENSEICATYPENGELYLITSKIEGIRQMRENDFAMMMSFKSALDFENKLKDTVKDTRKIKLFIVNLCVLTGPQKYQRRNHYRIPANWTIYFKIIKPDAELNYAQKRWIAEKIFESEHGHLKIETVDVGAGGFKSIIKKYLPRDIDIECFIEINGTKVTSPESGGVIMGKILDCTPNSARHEYFDVRVKFTDMPDAAKHIVTDNLMLESKK